MVFRSAILADDLLPDEVGGGVPANHGGSSEQAPSKIEINDNGSKRPGRML